MDLQSYRVVMRKLKHRYSNLSDLRIAMDVLVDVALENYLEGGLSKKDYWRICVETANIAYPDEKTEQ